MNYKHFTVWIFAALMVLVILMALSRSPYLAGIGLILLPILVILQAIVILRAREKSSGTFSEDQPYEDRRPKPDKNQHAH